MRRLRRASGNMMAMMLSTMLIMAALIVFGLWYTQHTLNTTSHRSAIDSAALAGAAALSRIVVYTPECGYVGLTGNPPTGTNLKAGDNWFQRVHSVNELLATNRVDLIIAEELGDPQLVKFVENDHDEIIAAKDKLVAALEKAVVKGGSGIDIDGNTIKPYDEALQIYLSNPSYASSYVPNTFKLTLGTIEDGIVTAIRIPKPNSRANLSIGSDSVDGKYRSDRNIRYGSRDYVFAAVGEQASLSPHKNKKFYPSTASVPGLPFSFPAAIQAEAEQKFSEQGRESQVKYNSIATAGGVFVAPADGQLRLSFPDGRPDEVTSIRAMFNWKEMDKPSDIYTAKDGDYPTTSGATLDKTTAWDPLPWKNNPPHADDLMRLIYYDWLRNCGSKVNVDDMVRMIDQPLQAMVPATELWVSADSDGKVIAIDQVPVGNVHCFDVTSDGEMHYVWKRVAPEPYYPVGEGQLYAETLGLNSSTKGWSNSLTTVVAGAPVEFNPIGKYDCYVRDFVRQRGLKSGKHVGEPLSYKNDFGSHGMGAGGGYAPSNGNGLPPTVSEQTDFAVSNVPPPHYKQYTDGPASGAPRPTFTEDGIAAEIRFRRQINVENLGLGGIQTGYKGITVDPVAAGGTPIPATGGRGSGTKGSKNGKKGGGKGWHWGWGWGIGGSGGGGSNGKGRNGKGGSWW